MFLTDLVNAVLGLVVIGAAMALGQLVSTLVRPGAQVRLPRPGGSSMAEQLRYVSSTNADGVSGASTGNYYILALIMLVAIINLFSAGLYWAIPLLPLAGLLFKPRLYSLLNLGTISLAQWMLVWLFQDWGITTRYPWAWMLIMLTIIVYSIIIGKLSEKFDRRFISSKLCD